MLINEARVQQAIDYLTETDFPCADAKVNAERWKYTSKRRRAISVLSLKEGTAQVKEAKAETETDVIESDDEYFKCLAQYEQMSAKRKTEQLVIEVWRTEQANLRKA